MPFDIAIAQFGVTVRADVVSGEDLTLNAKEGDVMA